MRTLTVGLAILATYRLTLLVTADTITAPLRRRLFQWLLMRGHRMTTDIPGRGVRVLGDDDATMSAACSCGWSASAVFRPFVIIHSPDEIPPGPYTAAAAAQTLAALADQHSKSTTATRWELFLSCPWCVSVWLGAGAAVLVGVWPEGWWRWGALALAASAVTGLLATLASPEEQDDL